MRAFELYEGDLIPLPEWTIRIFGFDYEMYQVSKVFVNPNLSHKINFQYRYNDCGDAGANYNDVVFTFVDSVSFEEAKKVLDHFNIQYLCGEEACKPLGNESGQFVFDVTPPTQSDIHYACVDITSDECEIDNNDETY